MLLHMDEIAKKRSWCAGKFKAAELIAFLTQQAGSAATTEADDSQSQEDEGSSSRKEKDTKKEKQDPQIVRDLNMTEFESLTDEEDAWLVSFYSGMLTC